MTDFCRFLLKIGVRELKSEKRFPSVNLSPVDVINPIFGQVGVLRGGKKRGAEIFEILSFSPHFGPKMAKFEFARQFFGYQSTSHFKGQNRHF